MNAPMLASDAANTQFVGAHNPDAALVVKFYTKAVEQPFESIKAGRPIFKDVDFVMVFTPGNQLNIIDTVARTDHIARFPQQWAAYKAGRDGDQRELVGTPVSVWPLLTAAQAEEFKAMKFFTVEQIANSSDLQLQALGMVGGANPHTIRDRAKAYLQAAAGTALPQAQVTENAELRAQMQAMKDELAALRAQANGLSAPAVEKPKRGRKPKVQNVAPSEPVIAVPVEPASLQASGTDDI